MKTVEIFMRLLFEDSEYTENILITGIWSLSIGNLLSEMAVGLILLPALMLLLFVVLFDYEVEEEEEVGAMPDREGMETIKVEVLE